MGVVGAGGLLTGPHAAIVSVYAVTAVPQGSASCHAICSECAPAVLTSRGGPGGPGGAGAVDAVPAMRSPRPFWNKSNRKLGASRRLLRNKGCGACDPLAWHRGSTLMLLPAHERLRADGAQVRMNISETFLLTLTSCWLK